MSDAAEEANQQANKLFQAGDVKAALEGYSRAIGIAPKVAKYYGNRSNAYLTLERFQKAATDAEKAIELDSTVAKYHYRAARAYVELRQWLPAQDRLQSLLAIDPNNTDAVPLQKLVEEGMRLDLDLLKPFGAKALGERFLANLDATPQGVYRLPSGLRFRILAKPQVAGALSPTRSDQCDVHYQGCLINGSVFDSSYARQKPSAFAPSQVIAGWTEALQYMAEGEKWEVYLPPELAYGSRGAGQEIPPNSTLVFTMELLKVLTGTRQKTVTVAHTALEAMLGGGVSYDSLMVSEAMFPHPAVQA